MPSAPITTEGKRKNGRWKKKEWKKRKERMEEEKRSGEEISSDNPTQFDVRPTLAKGKDSIIPHGQVFRTSILRDNVETRRETNEVNSAS